MRLPFDTSRGISDQVSVEEFLLRRCQIVVIDELDQFQQTVIDRSAHHLVLADGPRDTKLRDLGHEFQSAFGLDPEHPERARLSVAAFGGDQHGYTLFLGELTARDMPVCPGASAKESMRLSSGSAMCAVHLASERCSWTRGG